MNIVIKSPSTKRLTLLDLEPGTVFEFTKDIGTEFEGRCLKLEQGWITLGPDGNSTELWVESDCMGILKPFYVFGNNDGFDRFQVVSFGKLVLE